MAILTPALEVRLMTRPAATYEALTTATSSGFTPVLRRPVRLAMVLACFISFTTTGQLFYFRSVFFGHLPRPAQGFSCKPNTASLQIVAIGAASVDWVAQNRLRIDTVVFFIGFHLKW